jgi:plastocyanin
MISWPPPPAAGRGDLPSHGEASAFALGCAPQLESMIVDQPGYIIASPAFNQCEPLHLVIGHNAADQGTAETRCTMQRIGTVFMLSVGALAMMAAVAVTDEPVRMLDACDPATFNATFGAGVCADVGGDVTVEEFFSPNVLPEGHPAWENEPSYVKIKPGERVKVTNEGGEVHTFTELMAFGGGFYPPLNNPTGSTEVVPERGSAGAPNPALVFVPSGGKLEVTGLGVGTHLFECCIHPFMRAVIKVEEK